MRRIILFLFLFTFFLFLPSIKAEVGCCENTSLGFLCQEVDRTECNPIFQFSQYACANTGFCKTGCCVSDAGCAVTTGSLCQGNATEFLEGNSECTIDDCAMVCCIIGTEAIVMPKARCEKEAERANLEPVIVRTSSQEACSNLLTNEGCCKISRINKCMYTNSDVCRLNNGILNPKICSQVEGCSCTGNFRKGCHSSDINKVFNLDSCGNPESTYMNCGTGRCSEQTNGSICVSETCDDKPIGSQWCGHDYIHQQIQNGERPPVGWQEYVYTCGSNNEIQVFELPASGIELCVEQSNVEVRTVSNDPDHCYDYSTKSECNYDGQCFWIDKYAEFQALQIEKNWAYGGYDIYSDWQTDIRGFKDHVCLPKYPLNTNLEEDVCSAGSIKHQDDPVQNRLVTWSEAVSAVDTWNCVSTGHSRCYLGGGASGIANCTDWFYKSWDWFDHFFWTTNNFFTVLANSRIIKIDDYKNTCKPGASDSSVHAEYREAIWSTAMAERCRQLGLCGSYLDYANSSRSPLSTKLIRDQRYMKQSGNPVYGSTNSWKVATFFDPEDRSPFFEKFAAGRAVRTNFYSFEFKEWQPQSGGEDCHLCNEQGDAMHPKPCTQSRCELLGQSCDYNDATRECTYGSNPDELPPVVASNYCQKNTSSQSNQCDISFDVQNYERITIKVNITNEPAQCVYAENEDPNFGSPQFFLPSQEYLTYHEVTVSYKSEEEQDKFMDLRYLCKDEAGNEMLSPGHIYFKVKSLLTGDRKSVV